MAVTASWRVMAIRRASRRPCRMPSAQMSSSTTGPRPGRGPAARRSRPGRPPGSVASMRAAAVLLQLAQRGQRIQDDVAQQGQRPGGGPDRGGQDGPDGEDRDGQGEQVAGFASRWSGAGAACPGRPGSTSRPPARPVPRQTRRRSPACPTYSTSMQGDGDDGGAQPPLPQRGQQAAGRQRDGEDRRVRAHQPRVDHPAEPAVAGIAGKLCQQQEQRHRGELGRRSRTRPCAACPAAARPGPAGAGSSARPRA